MVTGALLAGGLLLAPMVAKFVAGVPLVVDPGGNITPSSISPVEPAAAGYASGPAVSFRWVGDTLRHVGTVVHQMLRRIAVDGLALWDSERIEEHRPGFISALTALGVPAAEISAAADKVVDALVRTLADERGRWLLGGDHVASACEYPITGFVDGELVSGRLDRTFIDRRHWQRGTPRGCARMCPSIARAT